MSTRPKKKICWNCEGNVNLNESNCPYCGVAIDQADEDSGKGKQDRNDFSPYKVASPPSSNNIPSSPYGSGEAAQAMDESQDSQTADPIEKGDQSRTIVFTMASLMAGGVFFLFGWILLLFANDGYLQLRWSGSLWFVYILLALPVLYYGIRNLQSLKD